MTPDVEEAIKLIVTFKYPELSSPISTDIKTDSLPEKLKSIESDVSLFEIKKLNDIEDKMVRGSLKKIYMAAKRAKKGPNTLVDEMLDYLKNEGKSTDDVTNLLLSLKSTSSTSEESTQESKDPSMEEAKLFDIKKLNDLEDKVIRGTSKKIYMSGKRNNLSSTEIIKNIKEELNNAGKMNDDLTKFLDELL
ncbi:hypothetical protein OAQ87_01770 [Candidatus Marinimicrobia bacterium]|nr:hypothetical protein [Candidatus Neomarinimicrobiota bacterium]